MSRSALASAAIAIYQGSGAFMATAVGVMIVGSAFAEHSWVEGLSRGVLESIGFVICFAAFGRRLGIRR